MNKSESAVQVLGQIEALIGASTGKSVVARIKGKIKQLKDEFDESVNDGNYDYFVDYCGMERSELLYESSFDRYTIFSSYKDYNDYLYLDEIESFISEVDSYECDRNRVGRKIRDLKELLSE